MPKKKLTNFSDFADAIFPHEADYLLSIQQFNKADNLKILNLIHYNSKNPLNRLPFDTHIDKRTYSYLKTWIEDNLAKADVDLFHGWLIRTERSIMTDSIGPEQEKELMEVANNTRPHRYYFIRFYQLMQLYRDYLMVRNRIKFYEKVIQYLEEFNNSFQLAVKRNNLVNDAAQEIVKKAYANEDEIVRWELLFRQVYYDISVDGYTRYRAIVCLTILYYNNSEFEKLVDIYENLNLELKTETFYSRRILANYYHNCAMLHSKQRNYEIAEKFGYLSIRNKNSDYLFYLLSLCEILLKNGKFALALKLMTNAIPELKNTNSYHSKIGFASFYIRTLSANNQLEKAISYAETFFETYKKEILKYRWHLFFRSYMQLLLKTENYTKILGLSRRYRLVPKERQLMQKAAYFPAILWYTTLAEYMELVIKIEKFREIIIKSGKDLINSKFKSGKMRDLLIEMKPHMENEVKKIAYILGVEI
jgi:hypothetical protein